MRALGFKPRGRWRTGHHSDCGKKTILEETSSLQRSWPGQPQPAPGPDVAPPPEIRGLVRPYWKPTGNKQFFMRPYFWGAVR